MSKLRYLDFGLYTPAAGLLFLLWLALFSATQFGEAGEASKQLLFISLGGLGMLVLSLVDYRHLRTAAFPLYLMTVVTLLAVLVAGESVNGAQRWLSLGPLGTFQPSELAKLTSVVLAATLLGDGLTLKRLALTCAALGSLFGLILVQPDLGTSLVVAVVGAAVAYTAGLNGTLLFTIFGLGTAALPYVLKEYQRDRLMIFVNPDMDPSGMGYSLVQSQTAIGSGGFWGKGFLHGHLTQHGFVPENWTDFIFSVVGEEFGLLGSLGLLALFTLLFARIIFAGLDAVDRLGTLLCAGVASMLIIQVFINIAMTIGIAPVVGLPLPFGSFGGTAMLTNMAALGIVGSVRVQSRIPEEPLCDATRPKHQLFKLSSVVRKLAS